MGDGEIVGLARHTLPIAGNSMVWPIDDSGPATTPWSR
jgi:hypothetical protein